jgi:hypothetical protein
MVSHRNRFSLSHALGFWTSYSYLSSITSLCRQMIAWFAYVIARQMVNRVFFREGNIADAH